jgi:hypothetical protein
MALDHVAAAREYPYPSWYHDPKMVENIVLLLEEKTRDAKGNERWKYGSEFIFSTVFPNGKAPWAKAYKDAPKPGNANSFAVTLRHLANGDRSFGPRVPASLIKRFHAAADNRLNAPPLMRNRERWDNPRKLLAAGLSHYCGLTSKEVAAFLNETLGIETTDKAIESNFFTWRNKKEYPFEERPELAMNTARMLVFGGYLKKLTHMTVEDLRERYDTPGRERSRRAMLDTFATRYEAYRRKHLPNKSERPTAARRARTQPQQLPA